MLVILAPHKNIRNLKFNIIELENLFCQLLSPMIITKDFNAYNAAWGSNITNKRGNLIEAIVIT